tara:strand:- start:768 stop:2939 length:2172 start_codon:yes stop_codon:yes gene_type:complete
MPKNLVIVESPTKARTIGRFLGSQYEVAASMGHVRDLSQSGKDKLGIDIQGDPLEFKPKYRTLPDKGNKKTVSDITSLAEKADVVYLATDADREGEAISWHLLEVAKINQSKVKRVIFHEITKTAVQEAFDSPRDLDLHLVDAYQARIMLDKIIGFKGSPVLWKKVKSGSSVGRVQSISVKLVVDLEEKIEVFKPVEYWNIEGEFLKLGSAKSNKFIAKLTNIAGQDGKLSIKNEEHVKSIIEDIKDCSYNTQKIQTEEKFRKPAPPFITSTLQQEASRKLRLSPSQAMRVAQQLYEGIEIGAEGQEGLITYMRTDSTNVAVSALEETSKYVLEKFGEKYVSKSHRRYSRKVMGAQEAHEAIRPTSVFRTPNSIKSYLSSEQFRLYELIWKRMIASQMPDAIFDNKTIDIVTNNSQSGDKYIFQIVGSKLKFDGFRAIYIEGIDDESDSINGKSNDLPDLQQDETVECLDKIAEQNFTKPPNRFSEASLIRALEKEGIGRPSTYATIVKTIQERDYVIKEKGRFIPTKLGRQVTYFLKEYIPNIMDVKFTAKIEKQLDEIAEGLVGYNPVLSKFYTPFTKDLGNAETAPRIDRALLDEETEFVCEKCERPMVIKSGRNGRFLACTGFPECKNAKSLPIGIDCPKCKYSLVERKFKGRVFYGCSGYPECEFTVDRKPVSQPCHQCDSGGGLLVPYRRDTLQCVICKSTCEISEDGIGVNQAINI